MIRLRSRKGVSGAISAMFIIAIFFMMIVSLFIYTRLLDSYNQTVADRNRMDWERDSESIYYIAGEVEAGVLNVDFSNDGGVTLHLVQVWLSQFPNSSYSQCTNQSQYWVNKYVSSGETVNGFGAAEDFRRVNIGSIGEPTRLSGLSGEYWKIKLVTERGNAFECQVPWPPPFEGGALGGYVLQIDNDWGNFQYACGTMTRYLPAFTKPATDSTLYRVLIRNVTNKTIVLLINTTMLHMAGKVGQVQVWHIIAPSNDVVTAGPVQGRNANPYVQESQIIPGGEQRYVYFGATAQGGTTWQIDPTSQAYTPWLVAYILCFKYQGETEARNVPTPPIVQILNP